MVSAGNSVGRIQEGITMSRVPEIDAATTASWLEAGSTLLVDVREPHEHAREHIGGASLMPMSRFSPADFAWDQRIVVHCATGMRSAQVVQFLAAQGYADVHNMSGGIMGWKQAGLATSA